jgi:outer membrane protein insertion porin family
MRKLTFIIPGILLLVLSLMVPAVANADDAIPMLEFSGRNVIAISRDGGRLADAEFDQLVPVPAGRPLVPAQVRSSVLNLYRTGLFEQVTVTATPVGESVLLHYGLVLRRWLDRVVFEGNLHLGDSELLRVVNLGLEQEVAEERLADNISRLMEHYRYRGFEQTEVGYRVKTGDDQRSVIVFSILEGPRVSISDIRLTGDAGFSRLRLLTRISSTMGEEYDGRQLDEDTEGLVEKLKGDGYYYPVVGYTSEADSTEPGYKVVTFDVDRGERFVFQVTGHAVEDTKRITRWMKDNYSSSRTEPEARQAVQDRIRKWYVARGYHFTSSSWEEARVESAVRQVTLVVDRGERAVISGVSVDGVERFDVDRLGDLLGLEPGRPFIRKEVDDALVRLEEAYREDGYLAANASLSPLKFLPAEEGQEVEIRISVEEGERTVVGELTIRGGPYDQAHSLELFDVTPGVPYVPRKIQAGRERLMLKLGGDGYLYSTVTIEEPRRDELGAVSLILDVDEGPQVRVGRIVISGNEEVDSRIIRLALDLETGELIDLEKVIEAQERVYRLGVMESVDITLADREVPAEVKDILVKVKERNRYVINLKVGYGNEDRLRAEISATNRNVAHMARTLTLGARSSEIEKQVSLTYGHPWFMSRPIDAALSLIDLEEKRESYSRDSVSILADFTREVSDSTTTRLAYSFEGLRLFDVSADAQLSPEDEGQIDVAAVVPEILFDSRDDFLDPSRGVLGDIRLELADSSLGSEAEFYKLELSGRKYLPVLGRNVLAALLRLGYVRSYGNSEEVIISKRFFLGGQNSVRGYALDSLGPRDADGDPIGGNYLVNANLELRYPIAGTFGGVLFVDSGSVWLRGADEKFKLRVASGLGLRWASPIGPLSLDYGVKANPSVEDEDDTFRWHFSIGHAF